MKDSLKKALESAVGIVGDPQRGYRAGIFFDGVPLAAVGPVRAGFEEADADAQSIEKALAMVLAPVVQEVAGRKKCGCTDLHAIACAAAHFKGRGVDPAIAAAVALGAPCRCARCHADAGGGA